MLQRQCNPAGCLQKIAADREDSVPGPILEIDPLDQTIAHGVEPSYRVIGQAKQAAGDKPVLVAGGANTVNQYLAAGLIDELWLHIAPVTVGSGPRLFEGVGGLRMEPVEWGGTKLVTHIKYRVIAPKAG